MRIHISHLVHSEESAQHADSLHWVRIVKSTIQSDRGLIFKLGRRYAGVHWQDAHYSRRVNELLNYIERSDPELEAALFAFYTTIKSICERDTPQRQLHRDIHEISMLLIDLFDNEAYLNTLFDFIDWRDPNRSWFGSDHHACFNSISLLLVPIMGQLAIVLPKPVDYFEYMQLISAVPKSLFHLPRFHNLQTELRAMSDLIGRLTVYKTYRNRPTAYVIHQQYIYDALLATVGPLVSVGGAGDDPTLQFIQLAKRINKESTEP